MQKRIKASVVQYFSLVHLSSLIPEITKVVSKSKSMNAKNSSNTREYTNTSKRELYNAKREVC